jgi:hypothetical protein
MNNYIAALDFGTQKIRVIVECNKQIVFEKNYLVPFVQQQVNRVNNRFELRKRGIKSLISEDVSIDDHEKHKPGKIYLECFRQIFSDITKNDPLSRVGIILIVPELYSEIQRFTIKEIFGKAGFNAVKILNFSKVSAENPEKNNNSSVTEVISVGADYTSFSLLKHENGVTQIIDQEIKSGFAGYYMDKLLFDQIVSDACLYNIEDSREQSEIIGNFIKKIEQWKLAVFNGSQPIHIDLSAENTSLKAVTLDVPYFLNCFQPFYSKLSEFQSAILERNKGITINQTLLAGELTKLDQVKQALNIQSESIVYVDIKNVLRTALKIGRDEIGTSLDKEVKTEIKTDELTKPQSASQPVNADFDFAEMFDSGLKMLGESLHNNDFENAESVLNSIAKTKYILDIRIFLKAANHYYRNNDFLNAYKFIKKAISLDKNEDNIRLFENIVFKEIDKLHKQNKQREIVLLLRDAKDQYPSDIIREAFTNENRVLINLIPSLSRGNNFTSSKKKKRH